MKLLDFLLSDDIRYEQGNKVSLMGILGDSVEINTADPRGVQWPIPYRLGFFVRFLLESSAGEIGVDSFELSMVFNKEVIGKFQGGIRIVDAAQPVTLALVANPLPLKGPGEISFQMVLRSGTKDVGSMGLPRCLKINSPRNFQSIGPVGN